MRRMKTRAGRSCMVAASSSSSEDDISLGVSQEGHLHHLRRQPMLPLPALLHSAEAACLRSGINLPASTRHSGRTTFQCKFVKVLVFFFLNYNIIYKVITIEFISFIFRFTNIEAARVISSAFTNITVLNISWYVCSTILFL